MPIDERPPARAQAVASEQAVASAPAVVAGPAGFREWFAATVRYRVPWLGGSSTDPSFLRPQVVKACAAIVVAVMVVGAWLVLRPSPHPDIATLLPRAGASGASGSTASAASPSGATGVSVLPTTASATGASGAAAILVHVVGAVAAPGVVRVPVGARVLDAVAAAGGTTPDADLVRVNLAAKLADGQRVAVPRVGEPAPAVAIDGGGGAGPGDIIAEPAAPIDLNSATAAQLDALPGVGPATAAAIVAYRTQHGPFRTVDALGDVKGIGTAKLDQLRPLVTV